MCSVLLCKGKAQPQLQPKPPRQKERGRETGMGTMLWSPGRSVPQHNVTRHLSYLHCIHVLLLQFVQAGQNFQSLSWKTRKEKKKWPWEQSFQCIPLYNLQYIWNYLCKFILTLIFVASFREISISAAFSGKQWPYLSFQSKYRGKRTNSYRNCL